MSEQSTEPTGGRTWVRRVAVVLLLVLACTTFSAAVVGLWARRNVLDTDRFVSRAAPLAEDPAVQEAISARLTVQLMALIDPRELFEDALPERGQILAVPLSGALEGFVEDRVEALVASDRFAQLWSAAVRIAHETSATLLRGRTGEVLAVEQGQVTLNVVPMIDALLREIGAASPELLGREIDLPELTVEDVPATAIARLEDALDVELGEDFGQFTVYDDDELAAVQESVEVVDRLVLLLLPLSVVFAGLAVWLSRRRRRTLLQLAGGIAIGMVVVRRLAFTARSEIADLPPTELGRDAAAAVVDAFLDPLLLFAGLALACALVALFIGFVTGSSSWAVALRRSVSAHRPAVAGAVDPSVDPTTAWVSAHRDALMVGGGVVGLLLLWTLDLSFLGMLVVVGGVIAYLAWVHRASTPTEPTAVA